MTGYKEWSLVCEALGAGNQTLLLRKGGIAEGREGFAFKHPRFLLFPTLFHQQAESVCGTPRHEAVRGEGGCWLVRYEAEVVGASVLTDWGQVRALQPFHVWKEEVVRERFEYRSSNCIHAALVRVRRLERILEFPETRELGGCRSWVELPGEIPDASIPVLGDEAFAKLQKEMEKILRF